MERACQSSKVPKFGDLMMKIVELGKFLKTENLTEIVSEFSVGASIPLKTLIHSLLEFRGIFCF